MADVTISFEFRRSSLFGALALATSLAWIALFAIGYTEMPVGEVPFAGSPTINGPLLFGLFALVAALLVLFFAKHMLTFAFKRATDVVLIAGAAPLALAMSPFQAALFSQPWFCSASWAFSGVVAAVLLYRALLQFACANTLRETILIALIAVMVGVILSLFEYLLPRTALFAAVFCLPPVSLVLFEASRVATPYEDTFEEVKSDPGWQYGPIQPVPIQLICCLFTGVALEKYSAADDGVLFSGVGICFSFLLVLIAFIWLYVYTEKTVPDFLNVQSAGNALVIPLTALVILGDGMLPSIIIILLAAQVFFIMILQTLLMADFARELKSSAPALFASSLSISLAGMLAGFAFGRSSGLLPQEVSQIVAALLAGALILAFIFYTSKNAHKNTVIVSKASQESSLFKKRCRLICEEAKLSNRQQEVFMYLAKGRNAKYISEQLFIAPHTAKAHIYRIYQKLDVHSQQELFDLLEKVKV